MHSVNRDREKAACIPCTCTKLEASKVTIIFSVIEQWYFLPDCPLREKKTRSTNVNSFGKSVPIIDSLSSHSAVKQLPSCSCANLRKRSPSMNASWAPEPEAPSAVSLLAFAFALFPYCIFTFVDSFDFTLGIVTWRIICRGYKVNSWQICVYTRVRSKTVASATKREISVAFLE